MNGIVHFQKPCVEALKYSFSCILPT
jgi:hypothetical protein